jgi:hypothetical protein
VREVEAREQAEGPPQQAPGLVGPPAGGGHPGRGLGGQRRHLAVAVAGGQLSQARRRRAGRVRVAECEPSGDQGLEGGRGPEMVLAMDAGLAVVV